MKKIKIKICEFHFDNEFLKKHFIYKILEKYYDVEFSEKPDYVFYNESTYVHLRYDCIRIFYTGENISPNFNICDYAIAFDYLKFGDRYFRYPLYLMLESNEEDWAKKMGVGIDISKPEIFTQADLDSKKEFCSFIYSNYLGDVNRKRMFDTLSTYKKVNAAGSYLNNTGGKKVDNKLEYETKHKFSIAFENSSRSGYTTEKLRGSITAKTIPIYWGNPDIHLEFNPERFINCHDYSSYEEVVEQIKKIDQDDDLYLTIVNKHAISSSCNFLEIQQDFEKFLQNIFDQPLEHAKRRTINETRLKEIERNEKIIAWYTSIRTSMLKIISTFYRPLKKIKFFESMKQTYFKKSLYKK